MIRGQQKKTETGIVKSQDMLENKAKIVFLGIGSNLGNKKQNIEKAKSIIAQNNIDILQSSAYYETLSWPNANHPKFLNVVLKISTFLSPLKLLKICKDIEVILGRKKNPKK